MRIGWLIAAISLGTLGWASPARAATQTDTPALPDNESERQVERSAVELGLMFGGTTQLGKHSDLRAMPLGWRGGYQLEGGLYLGAAGEVPIFSLPDEYTTNASFYQVTGEVAYDYSPLQGFGAIPFVRAGYVSTFQTNCERRMWPAACDVTRDAGPIGQVGFRMLWRYRFFESGIELHYQFGTLQSAGFRFSSGVRF